MSFVPELHYLLPSCLAIVLRLPVPLLVSGRDGWCSLSVCSVSLRSPAY